MFDTHSHLNFSVFVNNVGEVIRRAKKAGVANILVPGTDIETSKKAVEIAQKYSGVYAAVGIHPHHVYKIKNKKLKIKNIEGLLKNSKVVAIGEVGLDRHYYQKTKYGNYQIDEEFINLQKMLLVEQIKLAIKHDKSLIIHNWEAKKDLLEIISEPVIAKALVGKTVFHCCEPDEELLEFAKEHKIYIGVDGDVTYSKEKQEFVKKIPLELMVLETDSPYLMPEPIRQTKRFPNEPANIPIIADLIAKITSNSMIRIIEATTNNAKKLFSIAT